MPTIFRVCHDMGARFLPDIPKAEQLRRPTAHQQIAEAVVALRQPCNSKHSASLITHPRHTEYGLAAPPSQ